VRPFCITGSQSRHQAEIGKDTKRKRTVLIEVNIKEYQWITGWNRGKMTVYVLCGFNTTLEQDLDRIYTLRDLGYAPYVMIYDKYKLKKRDQLKRMQRWVNSRYAFMACERFEDYTG
jgi:hypothetical protein